MKLENLINELHQRGANAVVARYKRLYEEEERRVSLMIHDAHINHSSLPNNYWHKRHELLNKYLLAEKLAESYRLEVSNEDSDFS